MSYSEEMAKHYQDKTSKSGIKVGDVVEFKKYEDMNDDEIAGIAEDFFPTVGTVIGIENKDFFTIEHSNYMFNSKSVARVIGDVDDVDINSLNPGDEVLVKATVKKVFNGFLQINPSVDKTDVTKILKCKKPERFIVKEDFYNMYIGAGQGLVSDKGEAKIYTSRDAANHDAMDMHLNELEMIRYDD